MTTLEISDRAREYMLNRSRVYTVYQAYCGG